MEDHTAINLVLFTFAMCGLFQLATNYQSDNDHNNDFLLAARKEIDDFHRFIHSVHDQDIAASHHSKKGKKGKGHEVSGKSTSKKGGWSKKKGTKHHHAEKSNKLNSIKDNHKTDWGENSGKDTHKEEDHHHKGGHHEEQIKDAEVVFKDAHKHNKGNYQKGFKEKYHLDEIKKHRKYWNNADSHEKWKNFGQHESEVGKTSKGKVKSHSHKEGEKGSKDSNKKKNSKKTQSSSKHGHKKEEGKEISYKHEQHYHKP